MSSEKIKRRNWKLATNQMELDVQKSALESMEQLDLYIQSLKDYENFKSQRSKENLEDNTKELIQASRVLASERMLIEEKDLKNLYLTVKEISEFMERNPDDPVIPLFKDALSEIHEYLSVIAKPMKAYFGYPKYKKDRRYPYYKEDYAKYYQEKERQLTEIPYDELPMSLHRRKAIMHAERASKLLKQLEGIREEVGIPTSIEELEREAIEKLKEKKKHSEELSKGLKYPVGPEGWEMYQRDLIKQKAGSLSKEQFSPIPEIEERMMIAKRASQRERSSLHREGKIQLEES